MTKFLLYGIVGLISGFILGVLPHDDYASYVVGMVSGMAVVTISFWEEIEASRP